MMRRLLTAALLSTFLGQSVRAAEIPDATRQPAVEAADGTKIVGADDRLMIVDGKSHRVLYDDGHDELFCVTRRVTVGYDDWGNPVRRRRMHCR